MHRTWDLRAGARRGNPARSDLAAGGAWDRRYGFSRNAAHIDIAPGWRIRAITPLLKSGGYRLPSLDTNEVARGTIEVRGGSEFMGFETAFYSVAARGREPGVRVSLQSVEVRVEENQELRKESVVKLFDLPASARHVRLIFLTRISQADHDMAVIAARTHRELESVTPKVQADPKNGCV